MYIPLTNQPTENNKEEEIGKNISKETQQVISKE